MLERDTRISKLEKKYRKLWKWEKPYISPNQPCPIDKHLCKYNKKPGDVVDEYSCRYGEWLDGSLPEDYGYNLYPKCNNVWKGWTYPHHRHLHPKYPPIARSEGYRPTEYPRDIEDYISVSTLGLRKRKKTTTKSKRKPVKKCKCRR